MENDFCVITTAVNDLNSANQLAGRLVESKLAACVQMTPIDSTYRWNREVTTDGEFLLMIKTMTRFYSAVEKMILEIHPYELPEILITPILGGLEAYLEWIKECVE